MKQGKLFWRTNESIKAPNLRLIGADGKQIGIVSRNEALDIAKERGSDLIEIAPAANPPVAKVMDYGKFRYQEEKKLRSQAKGIKGGELKEVRFSPFIAENDYNTRIERIKEFLEERNKVRAVVVFRKNQMRSSKFGYSLLAKVADQLNDYASVDGEPKFMGRHLQSVLSPKNKANKVIENQNAKTEN